MATPGIRRPAVHESDHQIESGLLSSSCIRVLRLPLSELDGPWSWIIAVATAFLLFMSMGMLSSFGVLYTPLLALYSDTSNLTGDGDLCVGVPGHNLTGGHSEGLSARTAWIGSTAAFLAFFLGPLAAVLSARWGIRLVLLLGSVFLTSGILLTAVTSEWWQAFITFGVIVGVGVAFIYTPAAGSLPRYFDKHKSLATSIGTAGSPVGVMALSFLLKFVTDSSGWRTACFCFGGLSFATILVSTLFRPWPQSSCPQPELRPKSLKEVAVRLYQCLRNARFAVWLWPTVLHYFVFYMPYFHIYRQAECVLHIDKGKSRFLLTYAGASSILGGILVGWVADHLKWRIPLFQAVVFIGGIGNLCFPFYKIYWHLVVYMIIVGINNISLSLLPVITSDLVGRERTVDALGLFGLGSSVVTAVGGVSAGWIFDATGSYNIAFVLGGALSMMSGLLMFFDLCFYTRVPAETKRPSLEIDQIY